MRESILLEVSKKSKKELSDLLNPIKYGDVVKELWLHSQ